MALLLGGSAAPAPPAPLGQAAAVQPRYAIAIAAKAQSDHQAALAVVCCVLHLDALVACCQACTLRAARFDGLLLAPRIARPTTFPTTRGRVGKDEQASASSCILSLALATFLTPAPCPPRPTHRSGSAWRTSVKPARQTCTAHFGQASLLTLQRGPSIAHLLRSLLLRPT